MSARIATLISGRGSNFLAIDDACRDGRLDAEVVLVLSNRPDAGGLQAARERRIPVAVVDHDDYAVRSDFDRAVGEVLERVAPDWVVLAGFMRVLGADLVERWAGRMLNIHPSLLPRYPGLDTHAKALAAGDQEHGATVHFVTPELDAGPIITQVRVPVLPDDTAATLSQRVLACEHALYVDALAQCLATSGAPLANPVD